MTLFQDEISARASARQALEAGFTNLPEFQTPGLNAQGEGVLVEVAQRLQDNYPYFHPLYAGQMLKPPHPIAREAYQLAMRINPNNHALDGGRASSAMEKSAVAELAEMIGWDFHLGHLTGGGTMANLEALWVASRLQPGKQILGSIGAHYTHQRISAVLGVDYRSLPVDVHGRMDLAALEQALATGQVGTVVATLGTAGLGAVDPLAAIVELAAAAGARVHADAAYGGYFPLVDNLAVPAASAYAALDQVDSFVVDPHKHGLQPYGCGCVLFRDPTVGSLYSHDSPYTYFTSDELHLGEISLECSRAGAAAVALWATQRHLPLSRGGEFARGLAAGRQAALKLHTRLAADERFLTLAAPDLDILVFAPLAEQTSTSISQASAAVFARAADQGLHLALIQLEADFLASHWPQVDFPDAEPVTCLRSCLMKPEHLDWLEGIWERLLAAL